MSRFIVPTDAVIAYHIEPNHDWALMIIASRNGADRRITPMLVAMQHTMMAALCPSSGCHILPCEHMSDAVRSNLLEAFVNQYIEQSYRDLHVCDVAQTGFINNIRALGFDEALKNFNPVYTRAFYWLYDSEIGGEAALKALRLARFLADKHGLSALTAAEQERIGTTNVVKGRTY